MCLEELLLLSETMKCPLGVIKKAFLEVHFGVQIHTIFKVFNFEAKLHFHNFTKKYWKSWPLQSSGKGTQQRFQMSAAISNGYRLIFWIRRIFWNVIFLVNLILWLYSIYFSKSIRCGYERSGLRQSSNFSYIKLQLDIFNLGWKE